MVRTILISCCSKGCKRVQMRAIEHRLSQAARKLSRAAWIKVQESDALSVAAAASERQLKAKEHRMSEAALENPWSSDTTLETQGGQIETGLRL